MRTAEELLCRLAHRYRYRQAQPSRTVQVLMLGVSFNNLSALTIVNIQAEKDKSQASIDLATEVLCSHCQRTATNGIKCKGICVADNDY